MHFKLGIQAKKIKHCPLNSQPLKAMGINDFLNIDVPRREMLLSPILPERSLAMLYAPRGIGKSWLSLSIGMSVAAVHHAGTNGRQRGTSRREDALDTVIALRRPEDYSSEQGARFEIHFEKLRNRANGSGALPFDATLEAVAMDGQEGIRWLFLTSQFHDQSSSIGSSVQYDGSVSTSGRYSAILRSWQSSHV